MLLRRLLMHGSCFTIYVRGNEKRIVFWLKITLTTDPQDCLRNVPTKAGVALAYESLVQKIWDVEKRPGRVGSVGRVAQVEKRNIFSENSLVLQPRS